MLYKHASFIAISLVVKEVCFFTNGETTDESVLYGYDALGNRLFMKEVRRIKDY